MHSLIAARELLAFHDACVADRSWAKTAPARFTDAPWCYIELNHRYNNLLWDEEDLARRLNVAEAEIAANKHNIDGFNQRRNDAVEQIDEALLARLPTPVEGSRLNSETAGSIIDRLSILALKIYHMDAQTRRTDAAPALIAGCAAKCVRLREQRVDLASCLEALLADCVAGRAHFKIYRQFKMYNDPALNPYLYGAAGASVE